MMIFVAPNPPTISIQWLITPALFVVVGLGILVFVDDISLWFKLPTIFAVSVMAASILAIVGVKLGKRMWDKFMGS